MRRAAATLALMAMILATFGATVAQEEPRAPGAIRIAYLIPDGPAVDIRLNGRSLSPGLVPDRVTGYRMVAAGEHRLSITPLVDSTVPVQPAPQAAAPSEAGSEIVVSIEPGAYVTILVAGTVEAPEEPEAPQAAAPTPPPTLSLDVRVLTDSFPGLPPAGDAYLRIVNASGDVSAIDVFAERESGAAQGERPSQDPLAANLAFGRSSTYVALAGGTYRITVRAEGETAVEVPSTILDSGFLYTLYVVDRGAVVTVSIDAGVSMESP